MTPATTTPAITQPHANRRTTCSQPLAWPLGTIAVQTQVARAPFTSAHGERSALALPGWRWRSRGSRRRCREPDPLPGLRHSVTIEDVLSVRVDHLALDQGGLSSRWWQLDGRPLIDDRRHRRRIRGIRRIRIRVVRIGQRRSESEAADEQPRSPPAASAAVMEAPMRKPAVPAARRGIARHGTPKKNHEHRENRDYPSLHRYPPRPGFGLSDHLTRGSIAPLGCPLRA